MGHKQAVQRIPRPTQAERGIKPADGGRIVERPSIIMGQGIRRTGAPFDAASLAKHLEFKDCDGRHVQLDAGRLQSPCAPMTGIEPQQRVRIEQDHRDFRVSLNVMAPCSQSQVH